MNSPPRAASRCRVSVVPTSYVRHSSVASLRASATPQCGAGCTKTPFGRGSTAPGSFRVTRISRAKPSASSICMLGSGKVSACGSTNSCSPPMRKPASRLASANIPPRHRVPAALAALNTSTSAAGPGLTWLRSTCTVPKSSAVASKPPASIRSGACLAKSWLSRLIAMHAASSGSWIMAPRIADSPACDA